MHRKIFTTIALCSAVLIFTFPSSAEETASEMTALEQCLDKSLEYKSRVRLCDISVATGDLNLKDQAKAHAALGDLYYDADEFELALAHHEQAAELDETKWRHLKNVGWTYVKLDQFEKAVIEFDKSLSSKEHDTALRGKARALSALDRHAEAIDTAKAAVVFDPERNSNIRRLALSYSYAGAFQESLDVLEPAILKAPQYAQFWNTRADNLSDLGQKEEAVENYKMAVLLRPNYHWYLSDLAWEQWDIENYEDAIESFEKAFAINERANYLGGKASALSLLKRHDEAIELMEKALAMDPNSIWNQNQMGWIYWRTDLNEMAVKAFDISLQMNPEYAGSWYGKSRAYADMEEYDKAIEPIQKAIELGRDLEDYAWHVYYLRSAQKYDLSLAKANEYLVEHPDNTDLLVQKMWTLKYADRVDEADSYMREQLVRLPQNKKLRDEYIAFAESEDLWDRAIELSEKTVSEQSETTQTYIDLAYYHSQKEMYSKCIEYAEKAMDLTPDDQIAYYYIAECQLLNGNPNVAYEAARQAVLNGLSESDRSDLATVFLEEGKLLLATRLGLMRIREQ